MPAATYPPSPPFSTASKPPLRLRTVISYGGAIVRGNPLLYLPRPIRNRIYDLALTWTPHYTNIEIPDKGGFSLPELCEVDHVFYHEVIPRVLQKTIFTIPSDAAIYHFFVWLNDFECGRGYGLVTQLQLVGLGMWEKGLFTATATRLLHRCPNIKQVELMIDLRDLTFTTRDGHFSLGMDSLTEKYELESLAPMPQLEIVTLSLIPFMALEKQLHAIERERLGCDKGGVGMEDFWGLRLWIHSLRAELGRNIEVRRLAIEELFKR